MKPNPGNQVSQAMAQARRIYSETVGDHAFNPRNLGTLPQADGFARSASGDGDTIEIWLKIRDQRITEATFQTNGCAATIACCSMATEMIKGKGILQAQRISQDSIVEALGGLP